MGLYGEFQWYDDKYLFFRRQANIFVVRSRFGSRAKFEMVEVADEQAEAKPSISSFPTTAPTVTSAVLKAQRKKTSKKNK